MNCGRVQSVFLSKLGGEVSLFWCHQKRVATDECWGKEYQHPRKIECECNPYENADATEVQGIP